MDKRALLTHLQSTCPPTFLKEHHLLGPPKLILKKRNRDHMSAAASAWSAELSSKRSRDCPPRPSDASTYDSRLIAAYKLLLHRHSLSSSTPLSETSVLLLHEDFASPLPIYNASSPSAPVGHVIVVLGGVRDQSPVEIKSLLLACADLGVACRGCNLGRVPEFTSKIAGVMSFHEQSGRLSDAVGRLDVIENATLEKLPPTRAGEAEEYNPDGGTMATVYFAPYPAAALEGDDRDLLYPLINLSVCAIWRSHIAHDLKGDMAAAKAASLTVVFECGRVISGNRGDFMKAMEGVGGAPTEAHVLGCLKKFVEASERSGERVGEVVKQTLPSGLEKSRRKKLRVLDVKADEDSLDISAKAYEGDGAVGSADVVVLYGLKAGHGEELDEAAQEWYRGDGKKKKKTSKERRFYHKVKVGDEELFPGRVTTVLQQIDNVGRLAQALP